MDTHIRVWMDAYRPYELPLYEGEYELLDDVFGENQRAILDQLAAGTATDAEVATKLEKPMRALHGDFYTLARMGLIKDDYSHPGYPREHLYSITQLGQSTRSR
jgi:hypothetical protein